MNDASMKVAEALEHLAAALRKEAEESIQERWIGTDEYLAALDDAGREVVSGLAVYMTENEEDGGALVVRAVPTSVWETPEDAAFETTLEALLDDLGKGELRLWLDEMERLLKLHGRR